MPSIATWREQLERVIRIPPHMRTPSERTELIAAERIRTVVGELRRPDCSCCTEAVLQMERIAKLLEEVVG